MLVVAALALGACSESPTAPSGPDANVSGTYRGDLTFTVTGALGYPPMRDTYPMTATVAQSGNSVTISATVTYPGEPPSTLWDGVLGTIDLSGEFHAPDPDDYTDVDCGRVRYDRRRIAFRGDTLSYNLTADTNRCGRFEFEATLRR